MTRQAKRVLLGAALLLVIVGATAVGIGWSGRASNRLPAGAEKLLTEAEHYELLSVDPRTDAKSASDFHGYTVLGTTRVEDMATRAALNQLLLAGLSKADVGQRVACFDPRHGVRAVQGGGTLDLLICFECYRVRVYFEGREYGLAISRSAEPALDRVLQAAGAPLAPKMHGGSGR